MAGAIPSPRDDRDYTISAAVDMGAADLPIEFEVWQPPVEDQGYVGNCVAQSLANIMECIAHNNNAPHEDYSVGYIYGMSSYPGSGMFPREACSIVKDEGDVLREAWELLVENPECHDRRQEVSDEIKSKADKVSAYIRLNGLYELKAFMFKYNLPVMIIAPASVFSPFVNGYHAVACYGWTEDDKLKFTNSWGTWVHESGRGTCNYNDIDEIWGIVPMEKMKLKDIESSWAKQDIEHLVELGIIKGYADNTFKPKNQITREEMAAIISRVDALLEKKIDALSKKIEIIEGMI